MAKDDLNRRGSRSGAKVEASVAKVRLWLVDLEYTSEGMVKVRL